MNLDIKAILATYLVLIVIALVIELIIAHQVAKAAQRKNRSYASFFWISILVGPLIPGIIVASLPFNLDDPRHPANRNK